MNVAETIREMLHHEPFERFRVRTTGGEAFTIQNPDLVVVLKSQVFIAQPNSDRRAYVPLLHVSTVETIGNGRARPRRKGRR